MGKILYFDVCAVVVLLVILFTIYVRRSNRGAVNILFLLLTALAFVTSVAELIPEGMTKLIAEPTQLTITIQYIFFYIYFITRNASAMVFSLSLYAITRTKYKLWSIPNQIMILVPYLVLLGFLFSNLFHHQIFMVTEQGEYTRGNLLFLIYVIAVYYACYGEVYLIYCKRFIVRSKWFALQSMYFLSLVSVIVQYFNPDYLVEMFAMSIALLIIMLVVLRPEENTDFSVNLPSWRAYKEELKKIELLRYPQQIVAIRFMNAWKVRSYLGEEGYNSYIRRIAGWISNYQRTYHLDGEMYYEAPGALYIIMDKHAGDFDVREIMLRIYEEVKRYTMDIRENGIELDHKVCAMNFPNDVETVQDIIQLGHDFYGLIPPDQRFVNASSIIGTERYRIGNQMDSILNRAIKEQGFEMHYQPIYSVKERKFISAEALIRLRDSRFGVISPGYFIPAAENKGLIVAIGDYVLETVYRFISENDIASMGLEYIEINLSVAQCMQKDLPQKIEYLQEKYHVRPEQVNLEILETTYDDVGNIAEKNIRDLTKMGYSFSLDDYGTGYSNIKRISKLPLKIIKIDKSLVDDMDTEDGKSIIRNTVRMMKEIHKELVIEGVESKESEEELAAMGCDFIQGYVHSRPLPPKEFIEFIRRENA